MASIALKPEHVASMIHVVRGERVLLSEQLAALYGVRVSALNQAVQRNRERFPEDFMAMGEAAVARVNATNLERVVARVLHALGRH